LCGGKPRKICAIHANIIESTTKSSILSDVVKASERRFTSR
jgi:hypothetical protein